MSTEEARTTDPRLRTAKPLVYVASRASLPARPAMWRDYRDQRGAWIVSSWIDEAGEGETGDFTELWARIHGEIVRSDRLVLYVEQEDFPLKGALIEVGIALALRKPVWVLAPGVRLEGRTFRPLGSWVKHPDVAVVLTDVTPADMAAALGL